MENSYESGFAFVLEGATERVFYERLLYFFARKHPNCSIEKNQDSETFETFFTVRGPFGVRIIKMNAVVQSPRFTIQQTGSKTIVSKQRERKFHGRFFSAMIQIHIMLM